jgi:hypothetical protein
MSVHSHPFVMRIYPHGNTRRRTQRVTTLHNSSFHYNTKYVRGPHRGWGGERVLSCRMMTEINKCFHHESLLVSIIRLSELGTHQHTKDE